MAYEYTESTELLVLCVHCNITTVPAPQAWFSAERRVYLTVIIQLRLRVSPYILFTLEQLAVGLRL